MLTGLDQRLDNQPDGGNNFIEPFPELDKPITSRNKDLFEDLPAEGDDQINFFGCASLFKA